MKFENVTDVQNGALISGKVLLAEDNPLVALETKEILLTLGAEKVFVASSEADAFEVVENHKIALAIIDIKLQNKLCEALAYRCFNRNIPFLFATGYGTHPFDPRLFGNVPIVVKPYGESQMARGVRSLLVER